MKDSKSHKCEFCGNNLQLTGDSCNDNEEVKVGICIKCNLKQLHDFSHVSIDYYSSDSYHSGSSVIERERQFRWNSKRIQLIRKLIPNAHEMDVMDFGCGTGGFLEQAQEEFNSITGFDVNEKICNDHKSNGWPCVNSLDQLDNDQIDAITFFHVLEHVKQPWSFLEEISELFLNATTFVIEVPNTTEALLSLFENKAYRKNHYNEFHLYYFTNETLRAVIEKSGFKIIHDTQLQRYQLSNHFGWINNNKGGGQSNWAFFNDLDLEHEYDKVLIENGIADSVFMVCKRY